jgi:hypothetical protein
VQYIISAVPTEVKIYCLASSHVDVSTICFEGKPRPSGACLWCVYYLISFPSFQLRIVLLKLTESLHLEAHWGGHAGRVTSDIVSRVAFSRTTMKHLCIIFMAICDRQQQPSARASRLDHRSRGLRGTCSHRCYCSRRRWRCSCWSHPCTTASPVGHQQQGNHCADCMPSGRGCIHRFPRQG